MAAQFGITTLVNLAKLIVDKLEWSLEYPFSDLNTKRKKQKLLNYKKAIKEKDRDTLVYLLTKI